MKRVIFQTRSVEYSGPGIVRYSSDVFRQIHGQMVQRLNRDEFASSGDYAGTPFPVLQSLRFHRYYSYLNPKFREFLKTSHLFDRLWAYSPYYFSPSGIGRCLFPTSVYRPKYGLEPYLLLGSNPVPRHPMIDLG